MGRQSYVFPYQTREERQRYLDLIYEHNSSPEDEKVGEELQMISECWHPITGKALYCYNSGGRESTYTFFRERGISPLSYTQTYKTASQKKRFDQSLSRIVKIRKYEAYGLRFRFKFDPDSDGAIELVDRWSDLIYGTSLFCEHALSPDATIKQEGLLTQEPFPLRGESTTLEEDGERFRAVLRFPDLFAEFLAKFKQQKVDEVVEFFGEPGWFSVYYDGDLDGGPVRDCLKD